MSAFRPKDIERAIDCSTIEVASRIRFQLRREFSAAQTQEECLDNVFCICEIAGHPKGRPMNEIVVFEKQRLEFRWQRQSFQHFSRRNEHEVLSSVTPGFGLLLQVKMGTVRNS
jgi:hypothetical protein